MAYTVEYSDDAINHVRVLPADRRRTILDQVEDRLAHEPTVPSRNRKAMDPDRKLYVAPWELRLGDLRVYYAVVAKKVIVVAVGVKEREKLFIGGKEVKP